MYRVTFALVALLFSACVGLRPPNAFQTWDKEVTVETYVDEQAKYCTELHDKLNDTFWLDTMFYGSAVGASASLIASAVSVGASFDHLVLGQAFTDDADVIATLNLVQGSAVVVGALSGIALAYSGDRRASIARARASLIEIRGAALEERLKEVFKGQEKDKDVQRAVSTIGQRCYDVAVKLAEDSEAQTLGFLRALSDEVVAQAQKKVDTAEREKVEVAEDVAESADAQLVETLDRIAKGKGKPADLLKRAKRAMSDRQKEKPVESEAACLLGVRVVDDTEIIFPANTVLEFALEGDGPAEVYSLVGYGEELIEVELGGKFGKQTSVGPVDVPARLVVGDITKGPRKGPLQLPKNVFAAAQRMNISVGRQRFVTKWRCSKTPTD